MPEIAIRSCRLPQSQADALLRLEVGVDAGQGLLGLDDGEAELDEGVARDELRRGLWTSADVRGRLTRCWTS